MLDDRNHLKVIDFGTAKFFETEDNKEFYNKITEYLNKARNRETNALDVDNTICPLTQLEMKFYLGLVVLPILSNTIKSE